MTLRSKFLAIALFIAFNALSSGAHAQSGCTGQFPADTICANAAGSQGLPSPTVASSIINFLCTAAPSTCASIFGYANIVWFGAIADSVHTSINAAAFASALATNQPVIVPATTAAGYGIGTNVITVTGGQTVHCENAATIFGTGAAIFSITSSQPGTGIYGCDANMRGASPGSTVYLLNDASVVVSNVTIQDSFCFVSYACVISVGTLGINNIALRNIRSDFSVGGPQFNIVNAQDGGFIVLDTLVCDFTSVVGNVSWSCGNFNNFAGLLIAGWLNASGLGTGTPAFAANVPAWNFTGIAISGAGVIYADDTIGDGCKLTIQFIIGPSLYCSINLGSQIILNGTTQSNIASVLAFGPQGSTGAEASTPAILINGATSQLNIANLYVTKATGDNVDITGTSSGINIANFISTNATGAALSLQNSVDYVRIGQGYISGNGSTVSNSSSGTHNVIQNLGGYNPVGLTAGTSTGTSTSTITAGTSPETHYIYQTANFNAVVKISTTTICTVPSATVPCVINLGPNEAYTVTWTTTQPTYTKFVH